MCYDIGVAILVIILTCCFTKGFKGTWEIGFLLNLLVEILKHVHEISSFSRFSMKECSENFSEEEVIGRYSSKRFS